jgi:hypothetical protein
MTVGRCIRCLGHKKATYMGGIYVICQSCNGTGIMTIPEKEIDDHWKTPQLKTKLTYTEIKPELTFVASNAIIDNLSNLSHIDDKVDNGLAQLRTNVKIDKRSKEYRDAKLKEALENE